MPAIITNKFRKNSSEQFVNSFSGSTNYYLGIGRSEPFTTSPLGDTRTVYEGSDANPITPADSISEELYTWQDLLAAKKITSSNVTYCIPRRNWTIGTIYDYYRHDYGNYITGSSSTLQTANSGAVSLFDATFYVLSSAFNVYKCIDNNNGAASTVEPSGTSTSIISTSDGYRWKYMYGLTSAQQSNFLSTDFMAVTTDGTVSAAAVNGAIYVTKIVSAGTGGANGTWTNIPIRGDGTGGTVSVTVVANAISSISITNVGSNYTFASIRNSDIVAAGATGLTGAQIDCIISPIGGHGYDAVKELGGYYTMINVTLTGNESALSGDFTTQNDFRKIILIRNPNSNGVLTTASTVRATRAIHLASTTGSFIPDEIITQATTGAKGRVVEYDSINKILYFIQNRFSGDGIDTNGNKTLFSGTYSITGATSSVTGTPVSTSSETVNNVVFANGYSIPEIDSYSGDIMYIENRAPIARALDQTENIKLVIEF